MTESDYTLIRRSDLIAIIVAVGVACLVGAGVFQSKPAGIAAVFWIVLAVTLEIAGERE